MKSNFIDAAVLYNRYSGYSLSNLKFERAETAIQYLTVVFRDVHGHGNVWFVQFTVKIEVYNNTSSDKFFRGTLSYHELSWLVHACFLSSFCCWLWNNAIVDGNNNWRFYCILFYFIHYCSTFGNQLLFVPNIVYKFIYSCCSGYFIIILLKLEFLNKAYTFVHRIYVFNAVIQKP